MNTFCRDAGIKQDRIGANLKLSQVPSTQPQLTTGASQQKHASLQTIFQLIRTDAGKRRLTNFFCHSKCGHTLWCRRHKQIIATQQTWIIDLSINRIARFDLQYPLVVDVQRLNASFLSSDVVAHQKVFFPAASIGALTLPALCGICDTATQLSGFRLSV